MSESLEGVFEPFTDEQHAKVAELREKVASVTLSPRMQRDLESHPSLFLARWLYARKWDVAASLKMIQDAAAWRLEQGMEDKPLFPTPLCIQGYDVAELQKLHGTENRPADQFIDKVTKALNPILGRCVYKWDKEGRPVFIERMGTVPVAERMKRCKALVPPGADPTDVVVPITLTEHELISVAQRFNANRTGKFVGQCTVILDCTGMSLSAVSQAAQAFTQRFADIDDNYFPEAVHRMFLVNAPRVAYYAWSLIEKLFSERLRQLVKLYPPGDASKKALLEAIDADCLPKYLGGTCELEVPEVDASIEDQSLSNATEEFAVAAGKREERTVALSKDHAVEWQWVSVGDLDVNFSVVFETADGDKTTFFPASKVTKHDAMFSAPDDGVLTFTFDNSHSWMKGKQIQLRTTNTEDK